MCCKSCKGVKRSLPSVGAGRRPSTTDESYFSNSNQRPRAEAAFPRPWMHLACLLCGRLPSASDGDPFSLTRRGVNVSLLCVMKRPRYCYPAGFHCCAFQYVETRVRILHNRGNIRRFNSLSKGCSSARGIRRSIFIHSRKSRGEVTNFSCLCFACLRKMRFFSQAAEKVAVEGLTRACGAASYKSNEVDQWRDDLAGLS